MNHLELVAAAAEGAASSRSLRGLAEGLAVALGARRLLLITGGERTTAGEARGRPDVVVHAGPSVRIEASLPREVVHTLERVLAAILAEREVVRRVADVSRRAWQENRALKEDLERTRAEPRLVAESARMRHAVELADSVARYDTTVLIRGESGSGKEVLARRIHARSRRMKRAFLAVNCAAIPEQLLESELFGHERGAFTGADRLRRGVFERAEGGTLFLDEIGELTPRAQAELLRVLQERRFTRVGGEEELRADVRLIAATHRPLEALVEAGTFRRDLYYRVAVFSVDVPPLRARAEDLPGLVAAILPDLCAKLGRSVPRVSRETLAALQAHHWSGNVRELANVLEAGLVTSGERFELPRNVAVRLRREPNVEPLDDSVRRAIEQALTASRGRIYGAEGAARKLGLEPTTLQSKMKKLGIRRSDFTARA